MSAGLNAVAVTLFDSEVKHSYQKGRLLRKAVRVKNGIVGDTTKFRNMGKGLATQRTAPSSDAIPMNVTHSLVTCTLQDWNAPEYTDIFDKQTVNFDEVRELASVITNALGRREDQLIIDALDSASGLAGTVSAGSANLTVAKIIEASKYLNKKGVPSDNRFAVINAEGLEALLGTTQVTSSDYNSVQALVRGDINSFMGFTFIVVEDRTEGGLTVSSNVVDSYFFHKDAVGLAVGMDITTKVDWSTDKDSWKSTGYLKAGSVAIDGEGICKVQYDQTA